MKLDIHQQSLLTRKVFSRHNFSALVFFSGSSHHLHLQVIFILDLDDHSIWIIITGSGSSLDLDHHHQIWIITRTSSLDLDHHCWIWIITRSGSSLLYLDHHSIWIISETSSLDLNHHSIQIITGSSSQVLSHDSSHHRKFYRDSPFSCWLQAQHPCRSSSELISIPKSECPTQHLYLIMQEPILQSYQIGMPSTHI